MPKQIIRVFPRRTNFTPDDENVRIASGPWLWDKPDEVHVSVAFTWDMPAARWLAEQWQSIAPVKLGGPGAGDRGEHFEPGLYLKDGLTITSRGCPNKCWFCDVWKREGQEVRELPIRDGWNILDDNILATSTRHFTAVCEMLVKQKRRPEFTGGLEAARLTDWHCKRLREINPAQLFFAYDTPDDLKPLQLAGEMLKDHGFKYKHPLRAYVLCGYPKDSIKKAEHRMREAIAAGFMPMAMAWRDTKGRRDRNWAAFQRTWARPALIAKVDKTDTATHNYTGGDL